MTSTVAFGHACATGDISSIKNFLDDPEVSVDDGLYRAICNNQIEVVRMLLNHPRIDPSPSYHLIQACRKRFVEIMLLLLEDYRVDGSNPDIIMKEIEENCSSTVRKLIPRISLVRDRRALLIWTIQRDYWEYFQMLHDYPEFASVIDNELVCIVCEFASVKYLQVLLSCPGIDPGFEEFKMIYLVYRENRNSYVMEFLLCDPLVRRYLIDLRKIQETRFDEMIDDLISTFPDGWDQMLWPSTKISFAEEKFIRCK